MIERSLMTSGVTLEASDDSNGNRVSEKLQYSFGPDNKAHAIAAVDQNGTSVKSEIIATPTADYTRYLSIKTTSTGADGKPLDFSSVLGVWAKTGDADTSATQPNQLFGGAVLGLNLPLGAAPVPIGMLSPTERSKLIQQMQDDHVYKIDYKKVKKERVNGRTQYTYEATIQTMAYVRVMQMFAKSLGLHDLDSLDPNTFSGAAPLTVRLMVDGRSRQLVAVETEGYSQTYRSYDVSVGAAIPKDAISGQELQQRLSQLQ